MTQLAVRQSSDPFAPPSIEAGAQPMTLGRESLIKIARALTKRGWKVVAIGLRDLQYQPLDEDDHEFIEAQLRETLNSQETPSSFSYESTVLINDLRVRAPQGAPLTTEVRLFKGGLVVAVASADQVKYVEQQFNAALAEAWA